MFGTLGWIQVSCTPHGVFVSCTRFCVLHFETLAFICASNLLRAADNSVICDKSETSATYGFV
jgi:hypothetical protein